MRAETELIGMNTYKNGLNNFTAITRIYDIRSNLSPAIEKPVGSERKRKKENRLLKTSFFFFLSSFLSFFLSTCKMCIVRSTYVQLSAGVDSAATAAAIAYAANSFSIVFRARLLLAAGTNEPAGDVVHE